MSSSSRPQRPNEEIYLKKTQLEHILLRPDTYIGSIEKTPQTLWVFEEGQMVLKTVNIVPGLYKIFDEILVNAADNKIRDPTMNTIRVDIDPTNSTISVYNNGEGIPIEIHTKENVYIPELIFGHLLTSSNYNDDERKVTGGRNGYGAKLANIFSDEFIVETADGQSKYYQRFTNNMSIMEKPQITPIKKASSDGRKFTKITFRPDLTKFKLSGLDQDHLSLFHKRVYDLSGTVRGVNIYLNGERIPITSFAAYANLYLQRKTGEEEGKEKIILFSLTVNDRWEVGIAASETGQFQQISFVNSIHTSKGGTHVATVADQVISVITEAVLKKTKLAASAIKPHQVKAHLWVFINCLIENPTFDSQTKETLTLRPSAFGSECILPASFLTKIINNSGIIQSLQQATLAAARAKDEKELKKTDGRKSAKLTGIPKLDDANFAGTKTGSKCTLILTEGDSAKALAISGLSVVGRDYYGVYPLRGKLLNVRDASTKQVSENSEISAIKQILGLQHGKSYSTTDSLRYGRIMLMTDQDHDGSHIKGLIINFVDHFWPSLLKLPQGFLTAFITPIVVATPKARRNVDRATIPPGARVNLQTGAIAFYTLPEYERWKTAVGSSLSTLYVIKYYKGLGTSTSTDAKRYFSSMNEHAKPFLPITDEEREGIDMAFSKKKADARKAWLHDFVPGTFLDCGSENFSIGDFVHRELILFSMADNVRSIPSIVDGLKPGLRKVIFACFKRKLRQEIKVAQLAGYVSEHAAYHHGEQSLCASIIGLAQDFVGSNNISLLIPSGQFGTRLQGGKDAASPRYIFTALAPITRQIFMLEDDALLKYLDDDGDPIEPEYYIPIIPMVLVNGSEGIGTGWSTYIPPHSPLEIIDRLFEKLEDACSEVSPLHPWFRGFTGTVQQIATGQYKIYGRAKLILENDREWVLHISELPVGTWTQTYKEFLESVTPSLIQGFTEHHTDTTVFFVAKLGEAGLSLVESIISSGSQEVQIEPGNNASENLMKSFKLVSSTSLSNMVAFDPRGKLKKYCNTTEILEEWFEVRLEAYSRRKDHLIKVLQQEYERLEAKMRFIEAVIDNKIIIAKRAKKDLIADLIALKFHPSKTTTDNEEGEGSNFDYLLNMPLWSLTAERVMQLDAEKKTKEAELNMLLAKTPKDLWKADLMVLKKILSDPQYTNGVDAKMSNGVNSVEIKSYAPQAKPRGRPRAIKTENDAKPKVSPRVRKSKLAISEEPKTDKTTTPSLQQPLTPCENGSLLERIQSMLTADSSGKPQSDTFVHQIDNPARQATMREVFAQKKDQVKEDPAVHIQIIKQQGPINTIKRKVLSSESEGRPGQNAPAESKRHSGRSRLKARIIEDDESDNADADDPTDEIEPFATDEEYDEDD